MGIVLITPKKLIMEKSLRLGFSATNNKAEMVELYSNSKLITG